MELPPAAAAAVPVGGMAAEGMEVVATALPLVGRRLLHSTPISSNREGTALVVMEHLKVRGRGREGTELVPLLLLSSKEEAGMELVAMEVVLVGMELHLLEVDHPVEGMGSHSVPRPSTMLRGLPLERTFSYGSGSLP